MINKMLLSIILIYNSKLYRYALYLTVVDMNLTELFGYNTMNYTCIIPLVMISTNFLHYRKTIPVILKLCCIDDNVNHISGNHMQYTHEITVEHVTNAIAHLKSEKKDNFEGLSSDIFINGTHLLNVYNYMFLVVRHVITQYVQRPLVCYYQQ